MSKSRKGLVCHLRELGLSLSFLLPGEPRMEEAEASIGDKLSTNPAMALAHGFDSYNYMRAASQSYQPPSVQPQFPAPNTG